MPKKLVIFCDGTWNEPTKHGTNVVRMLQATDFKDRDGNPQIIHYIAGVGTRKDEKLIGGAFGFGISENIKDAYAFIVSNYEVGDQIYLFGFSRGAYTARSIAGLIHNFGVLYRFNLPLVSIAYNYYKDKSDPWKPNGKEAESFRICNCNPYPTKIRFLGVWDTVGALGAPYGEILGRLLARFFKTGFHDVTLSESVEAAYHALAADERRWPFRPTPMLLTEYHRGRNSESMADSKRGFPLYAERWFPGVHSNVGGGYERHGLSDYALQWMAARAEENGLTLKNFADVKLSEDRPFGPDPTQKPENSQTMAYRIATALMVKAPYLLGLKSVYPTDVQALVRNILWDGDYIRPIRTDADVSALIEKTGVDPDYHPRNVP
ncbi:DUF2235 domain-containing protein (plasmid) [Methylocystis sp. MJC1]|uniref:DUF2235 domain-containing protein n=1 Tax=Methylocystis sp. MJC1 TaxID=2654282 RepID=UPI0013E9F584|nr:DUF2235 domain-containing protein [Methylocystis sp. MJC1]KAF2989336.1 hypothetical protein MJC1_03654 [Methylocystis sp. MJC1]MBU6529366.1 DUF2235 domain-containing protein [Methylocystis sp. MJC1]UZX14226.1 DUF2235 domain-containing protein [Methylocystis sp. MJC1]